MMKQASSAGVAALLALVVLVALGISSRPAQQPDVSASHRVVCRPDQDLKESGKIALVDDDSRVEAAHVDSPAGVIWLLR
jgi:hypothetical protein